MIQTLWAFEIAIGTDTVKQVLSNWNPYPGWPQPTQEMEVHAAVELVWETTHFTQLPGLWELPAKGPLRVEPLDAARIVIAQDSLEDTDFADWLSSL